MATKKHIAFIIHHLQAGGAERVVVTLANELIWDYRVTIINLTKNDPFFEIDEQINVEFANDKEIVSKNGLDAIRNNLRTIGRVRRICKKNKFDLLIGFTTTSNVITSICAKNLKIPCIISERNNPIVDPPNLFWRILRNYSYKFANLLIVQTRPSKDFFTGIVNANKIRVILNPISRNLEEIRKRNSKGLPREKFILSVGRLDSNKAQDLLIKAFAALGRRDWKVVFLGEGPKKNDYIKLAQEIGIIDCLEFVGRKSNVSDYYERAGIFVFTSKSEGLPNALMEALYFGVPTISTDCPFGPSDLIVNNENGYLIPVGNQIELEKRMLSLMDDKKQREKLSNRAREMSNRFELREIEAMWNEQIKKLIF